MSLNCMRARLSIVIVSLVAISFAGCDKTRIRGQLKTLMDAGIVLPDSLKCVSQGRIGPMPDSLKDRPKLVVYIDTDECTTCRISHFSDYQRIYDLSRETASFDLMLMMADTSFASIPLTRYLSDQSLPFPVYVDTERTFLRDNPQIPDDSRMHSFLVDSYGHPKFVGDPTVSEQMLSVFMLALKQE